MVILAILFLWLVTKKHGNVKISANWPLLIKFGIVLQILPK